MYQTIRYEKQENIGILTINRPEALNALNSAVIGDLEQAITEVEKDAELGALIITGEGRSFVAGADIGEQLPLDVAGGRKWGQRGSALMRRIEKLEIPTIAAVNGFALGGGNALAERQPQAAAALTAGAGFIDHVERLGHAGDQLGRDAAAAVRHGQRDGVPGLRTEHQHRRTGRTGLGGVLHRQMLLGKACICDELHL